MHGRDGIINLYSNHHIPNHVRVLTQDALKPPKRSKDSPRADKKKRKRETEKATLRVIPAKTSKKKTRLASGPEVGLDKAPKICEITNL